MKNRKRIIFAALSVMMSLSMIACGKSDTSKKTEIRFSTWDNAEAIQSQQVMVDKFNAQSETVFVKLESYGSNYDTKITASMGGKDAPDVMYMWNYPKYGEALEPLDAYIEKEGNAYKDNFYETLWNYNKIGDNILGLPVGYTTHVLYYNKDLFDKAGVEYPTDEWTWQAAADAAAKITDEANKVYGLAIPIKPDPYDYEMFAWSNGGAFTNKDGNVAGVLNSAETVAPFIEFQKMIKDGLAVATEDYGESNFKMGKVGMYMNGAWSVSALNEAKINYGVALLPKFGTAPSQSVVSSSGISISKFSENKDAAWEFIKFWTNEDNNKSRIGYELPVLKSVADSENLVKDPINGKFYQMLEQSNEHMPASFIVKDWASLSEKLELALEEILNRNAAVDPQEAFNQAAK